MKPKLTHYYTAKCERILGISLYHGTHKPREGKRVICTAIT
jgi:hypothetical protein